MADYLDGYQWKRILPVFAKCPQDGVRWLNSKSCETPISQFAIDSINPVAVASLVFQFVDAGEKCCLTLAAMLETYPPGMFRSGLQDLQDGHVPCPGNGREAFLKVVAKINNQDHLGFLGRADLLALGDRCCQQQQDAYQQQLTWGDR